jgi:predicted RecA/RadA family phage recombinase
LAGDLLESLELFAVDNVDGEVEIGPGMGDLVGTKGANFGALGLALSMELECDSSSLDGELLEVGDANGGSFFEVTIDLVPAGDRFDVVAVGIRGLDDENCKDWISGAEEFRLPMTVSSDTLGGLAREDNCCLSCFEVFGLLSALEEDEIEYELFDEVKSPRLRTSPKSSRP